MNQELRLLAFELVPELVEGIVRHFDRFSGRMPKVCCLLTLKKFIVFKKKFYISDIKRNVMSSVVLNRVEENLNKCCLCNALTYNAITPPPVCWLKPSVDNGQQTTDNNLWFWRLSLKKSYSKFNLQKSYLTKFHKACYHALRWCIVYNLNSILL